MPRRGDSNEYSTHNLCFRAKIRKIGIPQFYYIEIGFIKPGYSIQGHFFHNARFLIKWTFVCLNWCFTANGYDGTFNQN